MCTEDWRIKGEYELGMVDRHLTYKLLDRASLMCSQGNETVLSNISGAGSVHKPLSPFSNSIKLLNGELGNDIWVCFALSWLCCCCQQRGGTNAEPAAGSPSDTCAFIWLKITTQNLCFSGSGRSSFWDLFQIVYFCGNHTFSVLLCLSSWTLLALPLVYWSEFHRYLMETCPAFF